MELQLLRCGEWSQDALQVVFKPPWGKYGERAHRIRPRAHAADESLGLSLIDKDSGIGINTKVSPADRWKGFPGNFVAAPRYSSLLKLTRRRRHELRMKTRDRVFLSISDWVFRRVNDPMVEIDPVTVNEVKKAEEKADGNDATEPIVAATASPSLFGYLPPGLPKRAGGAGLVAGIVLLLAALCTAAILALMRGNKKAWSVTNMSSAGQDGNGSVTNGGARQGLDDDRPATWQQPSESDQALRKPVPVVTSALETQATPYMPIPQYSTALDQSDLPLPPSFGEKKGKDKESESSSSTSDDRSFSPFPADPTVSSVTLPNDAQTETVVEEANETTDEEIVSGNGVVKGDDNALEVAAVFAVIESAPITEVAEFALQEDPGTGTAEILESALQEELVTGTQETLESAATTEMAESALQEELVTGTTEIPELELDALEDSLAADEEPVAAGVLPSASGSLEKEQLSDIGVGQEYILMGDSNSLSPVAHFPAPAERMASLPAIDRVGVPVDSILHAKSPGGLSFVSSKKIDGPSASAQEAGSVGSIPLEEFQAGQAVSGAEVAEERRKEYAEVIVKVLPAVSVGAGFAALSSFNGVDGALQVVGALATASFLQEVLFAGRRQQLFDDIRNIKSHEQLMQFLEDKKFFPESWSH